ncbi:unnamed protein product [Amoebophrya sp. A25]|nr:unnamed protein product [Amoebophrya sp. A25]|eukprot:GSA25T00003442001.1
MGIPGYLRFLREHGSFRTAFSEDVPACSQTPQRTTSFDDVYVDFNQLIHAQIAKLPLGSKIEDVFPLVAEDTCKLLRRCGISSDYHHATPLPSGSTSTSCSSISYSSCAAYRSTTSINTKNNIKNHDENHEDSSSMAMKLLATAQRVVYLAMDGAPNKNKVASQRNGCRVEEDPIKLGVKPGTELMMRLAAFLKTDILPVLRKLNPGVEFYVSDTTEHGEGEGKIFALIGHREKAEQARLAEAHAVSCSSSLAKKRKVCVVGIDSDLFLMAIAALGPRDLLVWYRPAQKTTTSGIYSPCFFSKKVFFDRLAKTLRLPQNVIDDTTDLLPYVEDVIASDIAALSLLLGNDALPGFPLDAAKLFDTYFSAISSKIRRDGMEAFDNEGRILFDEEYFYNYEHEEDVVKAPVQHPNQHFFSKRRFGFNIDNPLLEDCIKAARSDELISWFDAKKKNTFSFTTEMEFKKKNPVVVAEERGRAGSGNASSLLKMEVAEARKMQELAEHLGAMQGAIAGSRAWSFETPAGQGGVFQNLDKYMGCLLWQLEEIKNIGDFPGKMRLQGECEQWNYFCDLKPEHGPIMEVDSFLDMLNFRIQMIREGKEPEFSAAIIPRSSSTARRSPVSNVAPHVLTYCLAAIPINRLQDVLNQNTLSGIVLPCLKSYPEFFHGVQRIDEQFHDERKLVEATLRIFNGCKNTLLNTLDKTLLSRLESETEKLIDEEEEEEAERTMGSNINNNTSASIVVPTLRATTTTSSASRYQQQQQLLVELQDYKKRLRDALLALNTARATLLEAKADYREKIAKYSDVQDIDLLKLDREVVRPAVARLEKGEL